MSTHNLNKQARLLLPEQSKIMNSDNNIKIHHSLSEGYDNLASTSEQRHKYAPVPATSYALTDDIGLHFLSQWGRFGDRQATEDNTYVQQPEVTSQSPVTEITLSQFYEAKNSLSKSITRVSRNDDDSEANCFQEGFIDYGSDYIPDDDEATEIKALIKSESCDSEEDEELQSLALIDSSQIPLWSPVNSINSKLEIPVFITDKDGPVTVPRKPIDYFRDFFTTKIIDHIVQQSNMYYVDLNRSLNLTRNEFEQFLGSLVAMSLVKLSNTRLYWKGNLHCPMISELMSRDRWEKIKANLHFNNNIKQLPSDHPNYDCLFKIRPIIDHLVSKFQQIPMQHKLCIGEQVVPFNSTASMNPFLISKCHNWGYKIHSLCSADGILHNFFIYTGSSGPAKNEPDLGGKANIALKLAECIPKNQNHLLYINNCITSIPLITNLIKKKIYCVGSVKESLVPGLSFSNSKEVMSLSKGSHQEKTTQIDNTEVRVTKWIGNRTHTLMSTFGSAEPVGKCKQFDRKSKQNKMISCPFIMKEYRNHRGSVEVFDSLVSLYRINTRSKKFYHKLFYHLLDVTIVNSWLLYRRHCKEIGMEPQKMMMLQEFKLSVAESLLLQRKNPYAKKRNHQLVGSVLENYAKKKREAPATKPIPGDDVRKDGYHHYPVALTRGRCKNPTCKAAPVYFCNKCQVHLCISKDKNCFIDFHSK